MEAKFVCNLKKYRVAQELTQEQLADIVGVRRETIMRLEKAQYNPSLKLAIDISRAVKAPIEDIFIFEKRQFKAVSLRIDCFFRTQKGEIVLCVRFGIKDTVSEPATSTLFTTFP